MPPQLRQAREEDAEGIGAASVAAWQGSYRGIVPDSYLDAMTVAEHARHWRVYDGEPESWVVEEDGRILGYVTIGLSRDAEAQLRTGEVYAINVEPAAQRKGIGGMLLRRAMERLEERGFERMWLWVLEANEPSRRFYERHGWQLEGGRKELPLGRPTPAVRYVCAA